MESRDESALEPGSFVSPSDPTVSGLHVYAQNAPKGKVVEEL